ncbi:MAG: protein kinase domain-containing protein, partial [Vibrio sp.]
LLKGMTACIADGVSCSYRGQQASQTAAIQFVDDYYAAPLSASVTQAGAKIIKALNHWLYQHANSQAHQGMVTTFSAAIFISNTAHLFHVGDSRIYRLRDGQLRQLTQDHASQAFGQTRQLTRALGLDSHINIDYQSIDLRVGDRLLLSTDGVHDHLSSAELTQMIAQSSDNFVSIAQDICQLAQQHGSSDNASCLLIEVTHLPAQNQLEHQSKVLSQTVPPALNVGQKIDQYEIQQILHASSRSYVYQVRDTLTEQKRVLKAPAPNFADDVSYLKRFANEAWLAQQLNSPRIIKMDPQPRDSKFIYQISHWVDGITLSQWMRDHPKPALAQVRTILNDVVKALRVLQRADMVHCDLKPDNIMLSYQGDVVLIDLGAVVAHHLNQLESPATSPDFIPQGDANYTAPEAIRHGQVSHLSDLFALGVIGYEMLCGELPYKANARQDLNHAKHQNWQYRPLHTFRPDLPQWVDLAFAKAVNPNPNQRYQVFGDFLTDLNSANSEALAQYTQKPLIKRDPVLFWQGFAWISFGIAVIEMLMLLGQ